MTSQNVMECAKMMDICKSIVEEKDDYLSLYETLHTLAITEELSKINATDNARKQSQKNEDCHKNLVAEMKTLEDLRALLAQLVTAAKSERAAAKMCAQVGAIIEGFKAYDWSQFQVGMFLFWR